jgi:hypothetical protein
MTPLEAARLIEEAGPPTHEDGVWCALCQGRLGGFGADVAIGHTSNCPWTRLPAIVRALEAAEVIAEAPPEYDGPWCAYCQTLLREVPLLEQKPGPHDPSCEWQQLRSAMKGEQP